MFLDIDFVNMQITMQYITKWTCNKKSKNRRPNYTCISANWHEYDTWKYHNSQPGWSNRCREIYIMVGGFRQMVLLNFSKLVQHKHETSRIYLSGCAEFFCSYRVRRNNLITHQQKFRCGKISTVEFPLLNESFTICRHYTFCNLEYK
jgi:hypothetical protein